MSLKQTAQDVLNIIERGTYTAGGTEVSVETRHAESLQGSRLYTPKKIDELREKLPTGSPALVDVIEGTTQQVAQSLAAEGPIVLLNFASARNPGGGFLNGAKAQEEDLCRCSTLYATLLPHLTYYKVNRNQTSLLYTDHVIFSPDVPFFNVSGTGEYLIEPFVASIITAPAPNTGPYMKGGGSLAELEKCFERRWRNVLAIGLAEKMPTIILGAWGCGAFGGDPEVASRTAKTALADFAPAFERVVFAIPGRGKRSSENLRVFRQQFGCA
jgi:uncharacterized protein (TIGR02452 family)